MSHDKPLAPPLARIRDYTAPLNVKPRPKLNTEWNGETIKPLTPIKPVLKRKVTPHPDLWQPQRMPFERTASDSVVPKLVPSFEHVKVVPRPVDASPPILPQTFDTHRAHYNRQPRDLEANVEPSVSTPVIKPRVVPILGQLPDNWQLGVAIGVGIGLILQLVQTSVLKTGQSDIIAKLSGQ